MDPNHLGHEVTSLDDLANAADSLVRFKADEYARAVQYAIEWSYAPDFERLARLRLAHDFAAVECVIALARWIRE